MGGRRFLTTPNVSTKGPYETHVEVRHPQKIRVITVVGGGFLPTCEPLDDTSSVERKVVDTYGFRKYDTLLAFVIPRIK